MMHPAMFMLKTLAIGTVVLIMSLWVTRESGHGLTSTFRGCLAWGAAYFLAMSLQIVLLANI